MRTVLRRALLAAATVAATTVALALEAVPPAAAAPLGDTGLLRTVSRGADLDFPAGRPMGVPTGIQQPELAPARGEVDRSNTVELGLSSVSPTGVPIVDPTPVGGAPGLLRSFQGLDGFDQRFANRGNQLTLEPPDQGLCTGGGVVVEVVNNVLRVFGPTGQPASAVTDLNTFYGYPPALDRATRRFGPLVTDPTCLFDAGSRRWFVTALTLEVNPVTGAFLGADHLDVAVSHTADPLAGFGVYRLPVQDDGTQGTPRHAGCPCLGDYPHVAADAFAFTVTTNEYPAPARPGRFGNRFNGAQIYTLDKAALAAGAVRVNVVQFQRTELNPGATPVPGFTLAPAQVPDARYRTAGNGTQYFLDSVAAQEAQPRRYTGQAAEIGVYALTNTRSISSAQPALRLSGALRPAQRYVNPPLVTQRSGPTPLANLCTEISCFGTGPGQFAEGPIATNDSRMLQVYLAHGLLYGALTTGVQVSGRLQAGIAWFLVDPGASPDASAVAHQGYVGVSDADVFFPAVAATSRGTGAMAFTLSGPDTFPTAAYGLLDASGVTGAVHVAAAGAGPQDGFSEYAPAAGPTSASQPRWGDYGAAVPAGSAIWLATEYIAQSCSFATLQRDQTCGATRAPLTNWATRISAVTP
jgi:hypothetical protein